MYPLHRYVASASLLLLLTTATLAQDDTDLIDDLPKARKEATGEKAPLRKKVKAAPGSRPQNVADDLSPEQEETAERNTARKNENAIPDNLADALARALRNSPGILVADAKVRQAQAELNEVRLSVVQELTLAFQRRAINKSVREGGRGSPETSTAIMEDETRILYLLGVGAEPAAEAPQVSAGRRSKTGGTGMMQGMGMPGMPGMAPMGPGMGGMMPGGAMGGGMGGTMPGALMGGPGGRMMGGKAAAGSPAAQAGAAIPENVRKFLESRVDLNFNGQPLDDVLKKLEQTVDGDVRFVGKEKLDAPESVAIPVTLNLKQVTVELGLQALSDLTSYCFIIRDYGILVEHHDSAVTYQGAGIPMIGPGMRGIRTGDSAR